MNYELKVANGKMMSNHTVKQIDTSATKFFAGIFIGALTLLVAACCILGEIC
ncbi:MAG: hypothetical protein J6W13_05340 [Salinivirgaceae bacterium]|nr:hypothetical protein [Salinivirgaceae bacterium]